MVVVFLAWREVEFRRGGATASRAALKPLLIEATLYVLFAALWFGSLGSGGGWLLFLLLAMLIELPARLRQQALGVPVSFVATSLAILRLTIPGLLLGFVLA